MSIDVTCEQCGMRIIAQSITPQMICTCTLVRISEAGSELPTYVRKEAEKDCPLHGQSVGQQEQQSTNQED